MDLKSPSSCGRMDKLLLDSKRRQDSISFKYVIVDGMHFSSWQDVIFNTSTDLLVLVVVPALLVFPNAIMASPQSSVGVTFNPQLLILNAWRFICRGMSFSDESVVNDGQSRSDKDCRPVNCVTVEDKDCKLIQLTNEHSLMLVNTLPMLFGSWGNA